MSLVIVGISASRAIRPLWAACELGLAFEHRPTPYQGGATRTLEFLAMNPNGHIPVLIDQRDVAAPVTVWESMACALYLARRCGRGDGSDIGPASAAEEAEALRWAFWVVSEVEADALTVLMHRRAMPEERRRPELADAAEKRLTVPLQVLQQHLQVQQVKDHAYLAAARFTVADLVVASVLMWLKAGRFSLAPWPLLGPWLDACLARPAYAQAKALP